jgi:hypothetical protein
MGQLRVGEQNFRNTSERTGTRELIFPVPPIFSRAICLKDCKLMRRQRIGKTRSSSALSPSGKRIPDQEHLNCHGK